MTDKQKETEQANENEAVTTVAGIFLGAFFNELEKIEGLRATTVNLRKLVLDDGVMAEPAIRAILFPGEI